MMVLCVIVLSMTLVSGCKKKSDIQSPAMEQIETELESLDTNVIEIPEYAIDSSEGTENNNGKDKLKKQNVNSNEESGFFESVGKENSGNESEDIVIDNNTIKDDNTIPALGEVQELGD